MGTIVYLKNVKNWCHSHYKLQEQDITLWCPPLRNEATDTDFPHYNHCMSQVFPDVCKPSFCLQTQFLSPFFPIEFSLLLFCIIYLLEPQGLTFPFCSVSLVTTVGELLCWLCSLSLLIPLCVLIAWAGTFPSETNGCDVWVSHGGSVDQPQVQNRLCGKHLMQWVWTLYSCPQPSSLYWIGQLSIPEVCKGFSVVFWALKICEK